MKLRLHISILCLVSLISINGISDTQAVTPKILVTPSSYKPLASSQSLALTFTLNEPIICLVTAPTCDLVINLSVSDPSTLSLSNYSVSWSFTQWSQSRSITLTAKPNLTFRNSYAVVVMGTTVSNSDYYQGFKVTYTQAINRSKSSGNCPN